MTDLWTNLLWVIGAAALGFSVAAIFAGMLRFPRNLYLIVYVPLSLVFVVGYLVWSEVSLSGAVSHKWGWGVLGAALVGAIAVRNVLGQTPSPRSRDGRFVLDLLWPGVAYGFADAMLLSVLPVLAVARALASISWAEGWPGQLAVGALALAASVLVTVAYHLGYPEFRNNCVWWTVLGNGLMTVAYLVTMNPLAAVLPHIAMHIASIAHGRETTIQLPPHYRKAA